MRNIPPKRENEFHVKGSYTKQYGMFLNGMETPQRREDCCSTRIHRQPRVGYQVSGTNQTKQKRGFARKQTGYGGYNHGGRPSREHELCTTSLGAILISIAAAGSALWWYGNIPATSSFSRLRGPTETACGRYFGWYHFRAVESDQTWSERLI